MRLGEPGPRVAQSHAPFNAFYASHPCTFPSPHLPQSSLAIPFAPTCCKQVQVGLYKHPASHPHADPAILSNSSFIRFAYLRRQAVCTQFLPQLVLRGAMPWTMMSSLVPQMHNDPVISCHADPRDPSPRRLVNTTCLRYKNKARGFVEHQLLPSKLSLSID
jgi:hypothetical protein